MPDYLFTARSPDNRTVTEFIDAESANAVLATLRRRNYSDIVLHTDDTAAYFSAPRDNEQLSARDYVRLRNARSDAGIIFFLLGKILLSNKLRGFWLLWLLALVGFIALKMWRPWHDFDGIFAATLAVVGLTPSLVIGVLVFVAASNSLRIIEDDSWGRWDSVLPLLPKVADRLPPQQTALLQAKALAGSGRLDEGLRCLAPFGEGLLMPKWLYWASLSRIYSAACHADGELAALEKAAALAPENAYALLELAAARLRYRDDTDEAQALLNRARYNAISDVAAPNLRLVEGILLRQKGNIDEAKNCLQQALATAAALGKGGAVTTALINAELAITHAKLGNFAIGMRCYRLAEPRLRALRWEDLIARCEEALGR